ncbi:hypothetical protein GCM10017624_26700 [Azotobacter vinelandii]|nr:hypothetical protein GCM10017624_26700 [Azotobacter vinelandii]
MRRRLPGPGGVPLAQWTIGAVVYTGPGAVIHRGDRMFPWLWFWMPRIYFPLSGGVTQRIDPDINWFFDAIQPGAGIAQVEKEIFENYSYGRQLGIIIEALLYSLNRENPEFSNLREAVGKLEKLYSKTERIKQVNAENISENAIQLMKRLREMNPAEFDRAILEIGLISRVVPRKLGE